MASNKQLQAQSVEIRKLPREWYLADPSRDSIAGISLDLAYNLLERRKSVSVIVAVIDNGVDIDHEDLKNVIWTNSHEIAGNGIDDDHNGFVDDIHGWNFRGTDDGTVVENEHSASAQLYLSWKAKFDKDTLRLQGNRKTEFDIFKLAREDYLQNVGSTDSVKRLFTYNPEYRSSELIANDNGAAHGYGSNLVKLSANLSHGTHVAGIIAAERENGIGVDGIANHVWIMPVLATTATGDERDKDIANAVRYAVDNGARIINMSFSKLFSPEKHLVDSAIRYAETKDVLIIHAAGNDGVNVDSAKNNHYPIATYSNSERNVIFLNVGWSRALFDYRLAHPRSDYGKANVDLFAPGSDIFSTLPSNKSGFKSGSSMSAPIVSGIAALLFSYFPSLSARDVKEILNKSVFTTGQLVNRPLTQEKITFNSLSASGGIVNAHRAVKMAIEMTKPR